MANNPPEEAMADYTQLANEAKARAEKATPGPWEAECGSNPLGDTGDYLPYADIYDAGGKGRIVASCAERADISAEADENNAQFIAHARTDVPALADALLACQRIDLDARALRLPMVRFIHGFIAGMTLIIILVLAFG